MLSLFFTFSHPPHPLPPKITLGDLWETFGRPLGDLWETCGDRLGDQLGADDDDDDDDGRSARAANAAH